MKAHTDCPWYVYLLSCEGDRIYTGVTPDLDARLLKHEKGRGAKFTRAYPPKRLVAFKAFDTRSDALKAEYAVKQLRRTQKLELAAEWEKG